MMDFQKDEENDQFDRVPDAILRVIFNKLHDAQSLVRSSSVCKRFASIIPEIDTVSLKIPRKISIEQQPYGQITTSKCNDCSRGRSDNLLKTLIRKIIVRPIQSLLRIVSSKSNRLDDNDNDCSYYSPIEILKNFKEIQSLRIELPGYASNGSKIGSSGCDSVLRWRAEFGSELESCVIFGAKSFHKSSKNPNNGEETEEEQRGGGGGQQSDQDVSLADDELKLRVVWTISCLIAASARHYVLQKVVSEHRMIRSAVVADGSNQGRLSMNREHMEELRKNMDSEAKSELERTPVPALKMKLWYVPELELPAADGEGWVMKGATLLVIRPVDGAKKAERDGDLVDRVWNGDEEEEEEEEEEEKVFGEAAREMMKKKKTYSLEMNSF